jgi:hypothetical protein
MPAYYCETIDDHEDRLMSVSFHPAQPEQSDKQTVGVWSRNTDEDERAFVGRVMAAVYTEKIGEGYNFVVASPEWKPVHKKRRYR